MVSARLKMLFLLLVFAQAAHSLEEYLGRLWEVWAPARFVSELISPSDPVVGFLVINIGLFAVGLLCHFMVVRPARPGARAVIWFWVLLESANGVFHTLWAATNQAYRPGLTTALVFLVLVPLAVKETMVPRAHPATS